MIVHEEWTDQLSEYLDGELSADERERVDAHLRGCASCAAVLNDLKRVVAQAAAAAARPPQSDLWAGIAARIEPDAASAAGRLVPFAAKREARRVTFSLPQLAAAAALLSRSPAASRGNWRRGLAGLKACATRPPPRRTPRHPQRSRSTRPPQKAPARLISLGSRPSAWPTRSTTPPSPISRRR